ncbi:MAG: peptidoglycan recognition protein family protein [Burkholderiales bacterium]
MKQLSIVVLGLILLTGCQTAKRTAQLPPPAPPAPAPHPPTTLDENPEQVALDESAALLKRLTLDPDTSLPDAVLNATRCFVFAVPNRAKALSTCRSAAAPYVWSTPELMTVQGVQPPSTAFLIMVLSQRADNQLATGRLDLAAVTSAAGKTHLQVPFLTQRDLFYDVITYSYHAGKLSGAPLAAVIARKATEHRTKIPGGGTSGAGSARNQAEYVNWVKSYFNTITPTGIIIHHTAVIPGIGKVPKAVAEVDEYHAERGMGIECLGREYHVAYHYLIFPNGKVQPGRPERCEGAHARGYNSFLGISLAGDFSSTDNPHSRKGPPRPTAKQMRALIRLTRALQQKYNIPAQRILRHSDVATTACPGDRFAFKTFLADVVQQSAK